MYGTLWRRVINASAVVMSVDEDGLQLAERSLKEKSKTRVALLPICVDTGLFHPGDKVSARSSLGLPLSTRLMLFVGRLEQAKGTERLVDALAELATRAESLSLALIGDGSQRFAMEEQARRAGVRDRLLFAGWVDHDALPTWLQAADVLLLPSDYEGLPTAVIEALACGVPVVAAAVGGLTRLVCEGKNGLLLREDTSGALAAAAERAMDCPWSVNELTASVSEYSSGRIAARVTDLLRDAASRA
jgi:glycosyltransferase involved in cell wall biosynthesis